MLIIYPSLVVNGEMTISLTWNWTKVYFFCLSKHQLRHGDIISILSNLKKKRSGRNMEFKPLAFESEHSTILSFTWYYINNYFEPFICTEGTHYPPWKWRINMIQKTDILPTWQRQALQEYSVAVVAAASWTCSDSPDLQTLMKILVSRSSLV